MASHTQVFSPFSYSGQNLPLQSEVIYVKLSDVSLMEVIHTKV